MSINRLNGIVTIECDKCHESVEGTEETYNKVAWDAAVIATQEAGESISADHMGASCTIYDEEKLNSAKIEYLKIVTDKTENP